MSYTFTYHNENKKSKSVICKNCKIKYTAIYHECLNPMFEKLEDITFSQACPKCFHDISINILASKESIKTFGVKLIKD